MCVLVLLLVVDAAALWLRPSRVDIAAADTTKRVWLLVGLDDRSALPDGEDRFGRDEDQGARADVLLVATPTGSGLTVVSLPRDMLFLKRGESQRLSASWLEGPQHTVDLLCGELGIPVTDLAAINMRGFVSLVDALGGVRVRLPHPLRDTYAHISIDAGTHEVDGDTALALVRSRQGEVFVDGSWVPDPERSAGRQRRAAEVLDALGGRASEADVWRLHRAAWASVGDVSLSSHTSPASLAELLGRPVTFSALPGEQFDDSDYVLPNDDTTAALDAAGLTGCSP